MPKDAERSDSSPQTPCRPGSPRLSLERAAPCQRAGTWHLPRYRGRGTRQDTNQPAVAAAVSQALLHSYPSFRVYRIPVSEPENFLFRWWDSASLRTDETDPELLHWIVPIYTDREKLRHSLNVPANDHQILALLVDRSGRVFWRTQGPSNPANRESLRVAAQSSR
jgi:hypothetical protein